ncbi:peptidase M48 Ste24p [Novosphingobium fuchskuhlense]|uniref:Peptidase M48 Ste24p n=1 Tax=Novosphingobium fuchskuhlense TaxID=1117702 RepID=A0A117UV51_9SPHN|nr:M48 family metalloprotease [Novosphingobium fuchskuhlense]KUR71427.1 peptidase M48 Ste24p [Novosphingobium fuchskuhlense]
MSNRPLHALLLAAGAGSFVLAGPAVPTSQAEAQGAVATISAADKAQGAKAHPQLLSEFGGALTGPQATYVEGVGKTIALQSGLGNARSDFTVTLLNSPVNNAFAIPGGYVYVTRQLAVLMNNEAELAGVLGHEVGHVAARHSQKRESAATRNTILGVLGSVLAGAVLGNSALGQLGQKIFSTGSQLLTLKYSRGQESEADALGVTYLKRAGYDPRAMGTVLRSLAQQTALDAQLTGSTDRVPEWASTHPDPASRVTTALALAGPNARGMTNRDTFLTRIDGLTYGDDPKQGVVDGRKFLHPGFRMSFQAPQGFYLVNGTRSVSISGQSGKGELATAPFSGNLDAYVRAVFAGLSDQQRLVPDTVRTTTVNGIPAAYGVVRADTGDGTRDIVVFAYAWGPEQAFHFTTISAAGEAGAFDPMFSSMRRITIGEAGALRARRLLVVTVKKGDTLQAMARRMAYDDRPLDRFLVLNALDASSQLVPGTRVKLIVY